MIAGGSAVRSGSPCPNWWSWRCRRCWGAREPDEEILRFCWRQRRPQPGHALPCPAPSPTTRCCACRRNWSLGHRHRLFDAFVTNVDRTDRNVNLLLWQKQVWFIDHGGGAYFHHDCQPTTSGRATFFLFIAQHTLLRYAHLV